MTMIRAFVRRFGTPISKRTVCRILKKRGIIYKQVHLKTKVHTKKKTFYRRVAGIPVSRVLAIDEMGFGYGHIQRKRAWCQKCEQNRVYRRNTKFMRTNKTVICMINTRKVVHYSWSIRPTNTDTFVNFLNESLVGFSGYYLILDNVAFHKSRKVHDTLQSHGVTPIYIDPYSPEQNPIEEMFSSVKAYVKSRSPNSYAMFDKRLNTIMRRQKKMTLSKYFARSLFKQ